MKPQELLDKAGDVRPGEELDVAVLHDYLAPILGSSIHDLQIAQFPGGFSNLTYLLTAGKEKWVLRRPPFGSKVKSAHDMGREFHVLSALKGIYPYAPEPVHFCTDHNILGCDFYLMSCIDGIVIRKDYPAQMKLSPAQVRQQFFTLFDVLGELHSVDLQKAGLENFGKPEGYVRRQVEGWSKRYSDARTPDAPGCENIMQWLHDRMPPDSGLARIIHNDYKLDNVIWAPDDPLKIIGVLDWEMSTVGDPLMDLGCTLGYWVEESDPEDYRRFRAMPSDAPGAPTRAEIVARFSERTGLAVERFDFYFCFGMFRLAAIGQQIYYRYHAGLTQDSRFATMIDKVCSLQKMCDRVIAKSDL
ncbi:MAG: phosphotransferase family protein [Gammaproteobacteria bacterium]|nr:phosphotransferase family protein [Gammaproteobacteria bacterium]MDP2141703.1 phosphotransferase family protein [Gammaproteobacteria bacterium]MDP2347938.1 phosphotransferase family protein [Gammaproteobacteria bacterium]